MTRVIASYPGGSRESQAAFPIRWWGWDWSRDLLEKNIPEDAIRWHQSLMSPSGKHWPSIRPDIQWIEGGKVHAIEVIDTSAPRGNRRAELEELLGPFFGSYEAKYV